MPGHRTGCAGHARLEEFNRKKDVDGRDNPAMTICFRETAMLATANPQKVKASSTRWLKLALTIFAALILLIIVGLFVLDRYERAEFARFYDAHPMLGMMSKFPKTEDPGMVEVLLTRVPKGTTRADAIQILAGEGMRCGSRKLLVCEVKNREPQMLIPQWLVEVHFDESDKVSGGRVLALKGS